MTWFILNYYILQGGHMKPKGLIAALIMVLACAGLAMAGPLRERLGELVTLRNAIDTVGVATIVGLLLSITKIKSAVVELIQAIRAVKSFVRTFRTALNSGGDVSTKKVRESFDKMCEEIDDFVEATAGLLQDRKQGNIADMLRKDRLK
jgi:Na+/H+-dicarboxylate symporter